MKKMKKFLSVGMILCMAVTMFLTGCGKGGEQRKEAENTGISTADAEKPVTLKFLTFGNSGTKTEGIELVWKEINKKLPEVLPNTQLEPMFLESAQYKQKWDMMIAAGEEIDVAWTGYLIPFAEEVEKGSYKELDALVEKFGVDLKKEIPEWYMDLGRYKGKLYQVPAFKDQVGLRIGAYMPKELYDKYWDKEGAKKVFSDYSGLPYRQATQEMYDFFEAWMEKLKNNNELKSGFSPWIWAQFNQGILMNGSAEAAAPYPAIIRLPARGHQWDLTVRNYYELPETKLFYKTMADWYTKGYMRKDMMTLENPREFENNKDQTGYAAWFHTYMNFQNDDVVREVPQSTKSTGQYYLPTVQVRLEKDFYLTPWGSSAGLTIPYTSKNPERAMQLINLLNSGKGQEIYNMMAFGLEGTHYKKLEGKTIETLPGDGKLSYGMNNFNVGSLKFSYETINTPIPGLTSNVEALNGNAIKAPLAGFSPDQKPLVNEIAQIKSVIATYSKTLVCGSLGNQWEEKYNEFLGKLKAAGVDKTIQEMQKQVDALLKEKGISKNGVIAK